MVQIERDAAHEAAERELAKPIYPRQTLTDRFSEWFDDVIYRVVQKGSELPGGWLTLALLSTLLVVAVVVAVRVARRAIRTRSGGDSPLFGATELGAAEYRELAERDALNADWSAAIRHRLRAIARQLEEDGVFPPMPGRTANELARDAGQTLPALSDELSNAARSFNDVTYGERPGTEPAYQAIAQLDHRLRSGAQLAAATTPAPGGSDHWAQLR